MFTFAQHKEKKHEFPLCIAATFPVHFPSSPLKLYIRWNNNNISLLSQLTWTVQFRCIIMGIIELLNTAKLYTHALPAITIGRIHSLWVSHVARIPHYWINIELGANAMQISVRTHENVLNLSGFSWIECVRNEQERKYMRILMCDIYRR